ncbi:hypothetical protein GL213_12815 [Halogeometricum borinquense]|uniref:Uncharacterized protein n=1 Tax=Halogeometricum borinquense TaxID=60847 RepID=A0A6C0UD55_9EURY|nr:hypothetical protein [Halogeometricum borinquense]QIB73274.1 hypothetical protein G3I44_02625 [Halogeometricum borinquense]QIQ77331.1 hypothetical protein GL213_12815 [Halogeometricum borinquense]
MSVRRRWCGQRDEHTPKDRTDRALSPVVGKALELGIVVLFIALVTTTFYGDVIPGYRTTAAAEVAERTVVDAAASVEETVPERTRRIDRRVAVSLPATIRGDPYRLRATSPANESTTALVLEHPDEGVGGRVTLSFPVREVAVSGTWQSTSESWAVVSNDGSRIVVTLENGRNAASGVVNAVAGGAP